MISIWGYQVHVADSHTNDKVQQEEILAKERRKTEAEKKRDQNGNIRVLKIELNLMREKLINYQMGESIKSKFASSYAINWRLKVLTFREKLIIRNIFWNL